MAMQRTPVDPAEVLTVMDQYLSRDTAELDQKVMFAQRKIEFLEDFGMSVKRWSYIFFNMKVYKYLYMSVLSVKIICLFSLEFNKPTYLYWRTLLVIHLVATITVGQNIQESS